MTDNDKIMITKTLVSYEFPPNVKILNLISKALSVPPERIKNIVQEQSYQGKASFSSLLSVLSETMFNTLTLWDELLPQCLLLGRITASQIESYASPLSEKDREKAREVLLTAESSWSSSINAHTEAYKRYTRCDEKPSPPFDVFRNNLLELMRDLRQRKH